MFSRLLWAMTVVAAGGAVVASPAGAAAPDLVLTPQESAWLAAHPVIRLAPDRSYPPIESMTTDGRHVGIAADYVALLEQKLGIHFTLTTRDRWDQILADLRGKQVDVLASCVVTPDRQQFALFTAPYLNLKNVIIVRKDAPEHLQLKDLRGLKVNVGSGHAIHEFLVSREMNVETVPDLRTGLRKVSFGSSDAMIGDIAAASYLIQRDGITNLRIAGDAGYDYRFAFACRNDWPELKSILDKGLAMITTAERRAVYTRWVHLEEPSIWTNRQFWLAVGSAVLVAGLVFVGVVAWNRSLTRQVRARTEELRRELAERRRAEEALSRSEQNYREIFNATREAIIIHEAETSAILDVNEAMLGMFGYTREEALGLKVSDISADAPPASPETLEPLRRRLQAGPELIECRAVRKDGTIFWVEVSVRLADIGGEGRVLAVVRDITHRKQADEQRRRLEEDLRHAQKMEVIGTLASGIAHDFNNLLTIISGFTGLARDQLESGHVAQEPLRTVEQAVKDASGITRSLLTLSRKAAAIKSPVDLGQVVRDSLRLARRVLPASIDIRELLAGDEPVFVNADVGQLHQVLLNLVTNARDAMPEGGRIEVALTKGRSPVGAPVCDGNAKMFALLTVQDTGLGIPDEAIEHVFDPFFTTKPRGKGTGLGLAMAQAIIREHDGVIRIQSAPGLGTRVTISLPTCESQPLNPEPGGRTTKPDGAGRSVLLAEDSLEVRAVIARALEGAGYRVTQAASGDEAAALISAEPFSCDIAVVDVDLPGVDGLHVARRAHELRPELPIILISGNAEVQVTENGRLRFLRKPFAMRELVELTVRMLEG